MSTTAKATWFEITTNDTAAARAFYEGRFGWSARSLSFDRFGPSATLTT
jgi:predicted enzyme related to lactoylglutathione lyase